MAVFKHYAESEKQYQKQYQKQHQQYQKQFKDHQKKNPHHQSPHDYGSQELAKWRTEPEGKPLSDSEVEDLFWSKLVQLGWRFHNNERIDRLKSVQLMFVCQDCGKGLHSQQSHTITPERLKAMIDVRWLNQVVQKHKTDTTKGCKQPEYDENGEAISEALPEALPIFEKPKTGTVRLDTITNTWTIFNGERWIPHTK